jgi:hypothetical protein
MIARVGGRSPNHIASQRIYQVMVLELWSGIKIRLIIRAIKACGMTSVVNPMSWVDGGKGIHNVQVWHSHTLRVRSGVGSDFGRCDHGLLVVVLSTPKR